MGVGATIVGFSDAAGDLTLVAGSGFSASGSYPSFSIRSASSFALFSASSKSISSPTTFLAPSFGAFFAPRMLARFGPVEVGPFLIADELVVWTVVGADGLFSASTEASGDGDFERVVPFPLVLAERKGEAVREPTGGVPVREGGLLGRLIVGLSHEEKKSSDGSPAGVEEPSVEIVAGTSVTITSSGYLYRR